MFKKIALVIAVLVSITIMIIYQSKDIQPQKILEVKPVTADRVDTSQLETRLPRTSKPTSSKVRSYEAPEDDLEEEAEISESEQEYRDTLERASKEGYGSTPPITENNPQVNSVLEAISSKQHPERLSPIIKPKVFDFQAYQDDSSYRQKYLDTAEFGRVFQSLDPGEGIPAIKRESPYYQKVMQGETISLAVKSVPGMPVSFTSFDLGKFDNGLTTQTVEASSSGYASVTFYGMSGTIADTNILASSPAASGQVKFLVYTTLKMEEKNE